MGRHVYLMIGILCFALVYCLAANSELEEENSQEELYCEMVKIGRESNLEYGWPDFNKNYDKICNHAQ